ncbi:nuclear transport factor 2 family protein [Actinoplanes sp. NPDC004185]
MTTSPQVSADPLVYQEVQQFYARQMRLLDEGEVDRWAGTFTEDGVFTANAHPHPQQGRAAIKEGAAAAARQMAERGVQRRHWLGMLSVGERPDGSLLAHTYALVVETTRGGSSELRLSCTCDDTLVRVDDELKVRHRQVRRDDLPAA